MTQSNNQLLNKYQVIPRTYCDRLLGCIENNGCPCDKCKSMKKLLVNKTTYLVCKSPDNHDKHTLSIFYNKRSKKCILYINTITQNVKKNITF